MAVLATPFFLQFVDNDGVPVRNGKVFTYAAGTTTPKATFTDHTEAFQATNPVLLDAAGRTTIWINGAYKFVLVDEDNVVIKTTDNVTSFSTPAGAAEPFSQTFSGDGTNKNFTLTESMGDDPLNIFVFVDNNDGKGRQILLPSQYTLSGTSLVLGTAPAVGTNNVYVVAPSTLLGQAAASAQAAATSEANASASEAAASASALAADGSESSAAASAVLAQNWAEQAENLYGDLAAVQAAVADAESARDEAEEFSDDAEEFRDEAQLAASAAIAAVGAVKISVNDTTPGVLNGKLVAGTNISLTENNGGGNETLSVALTGVVPIANGGTGSGSAAAARNALGLGSAAILNTGTAAGNAVALDGSARLPAVDGSLLTNLPPTGLKIYDLTLADQNAGFIDVSALNSGFFFLSVPGASSTIATRHTGSGIFRGAGSSECILSIYSTADFVVDATNGTLSNGGGSASKTTVRMDTTNGRFYISNRSGQSNGYRLTVLGAA